MESVMAGFILTGLLLLQVVPSTLADYTCLCSYQVETEIYSKPDQSSPIDDYMYEFDCKPVYTVDGLDPAFVAIGNNNQVCAEILISK